MSLLYIDIDKLSICDKSSKILYNLPTEVKIMEMKKQYFANVETSNIIRSSNGKPLFENGNMYIGVSDSKAKKVYAISQSDFGIDLEYIRTKKYIDIAEYYFHKDEIDTLRSSKNIAIDFFTLWTLKEAFIKLLDQTISCIRQTPCFNIREHSYQHTSYEYAFTTYMLDDDYILSLAYYEGESLEIVSNDIVIKQVLY